ncbi:hypothetical protein D9757_006646 [Collybiopsis confluens]|uniref:Uncharacterized protein n=1 Tax=Collybiopsis confluens TaxID=2823264 RepID=A0A8H5HN08_9AGAR|nr:hypothetical protein D9757_006646 [Collybiopsis confluens]
MSFLRQHTSLAEVQRSMFGDRLHLFVGVGTSGPEDPEPARILGTAAALTKSVLNIVTEREKYYLNRLGLPGAFPFEHSAAVSLEMQNQNDCVAYGLFRRDDHNALTERNSADHYCIPELRDSKCVPSFVENGDESSGCYCFSIRKDIFDMISCFWEERGDRLVYRFRPFGIVYGLAQPFDFLLFYCFLSRRRKKDVESSPNYGSVDRGQHGTEDEAIDELIYVGEDLFTVYPMEHFLAGDEILGSRSSHGEEDSIPRLLLAPTLSEEATNSSASLCPIFAYNITSVQLDVLNDCNPAASESMKISMRKSYNMIIFVKVKPTSMLSANALSNVFSTESYLLHPTLWIVPPLLLPLSLTQWRPVVKNLLAVRDGEACVLNYISPGSTLKSSTPTGDGKENIHALVANLIYAGSTRLSLSPPTHSMTVIFLY